VSELWHSPQGYLYAVAMTALVACGWFVFARDRSVIASWLALAATLSAFWFVLGYHLVGLTKTKRVPSSYKVDIIAEAKIGMAWAGMYAGLFAFALCFAVLTWRYTRNRR